MSLDSTQTRTSQRRPGLAILLITFTRRATDFGCMRLPFVEEPPAAPPGVGDRRSREQITSTGIVIIGLLEVIFVGFLVGSTQGMLHPVWKVIMSLAAIGIAGSVLRLRRLIKGRAAKATNPGEARDWPVMHGTQQKAEA
jgi:hypothetical protein